MFPLLSHFPTANYLYPIYFTQFTMDTSEKIALLRRNTCEIVTDDELQKLIETKKNPTVYLGTAITGRPHIGYFVWVIKMADFLKAGFKVKILLADIHGALDNTPWPILEKRYHYYSSAIPLMFKAIGADVQKIEMVKGSHYQLKKEYIFDVLKLSTMTSVHDATKAASEVVKFGDNPRLGGLIYPIMQALDEQYLMADVQYGGVDQRKIFMFAREHLPKLGYRSRVEFMTPLVPGLLGKKMSASEHHSKIDLLDAETDVKTKIMGAYCPEGEDKDNGVLAFLKYVIMVLKEDRGEELVIKRPTKYGGPISFSTYTELEKAYLQKQLHPQDLKVAAAAEISALLTIFQKNKSSLTKLVREAYS
jgi:tyrosyl-tRNA synthetase